MKSIGVLPYNSIAGCHFSTDYCSEGAKLVLYSASEARHSPFPTNYSSPGVGTVGRLLLKEQVVIIGKNGYGRGLADPMQLNYLIGRHGFCLRIVGALAVNEEVPN